MKRLLLAISLFALVISLAPGVKAHPGRTDGSGGHTNQSTGEYHYHHGYSAHSHYDMDGDGDVDCPYDFDDRTDHSSDNGSGISSDITDKPDSQKSDSKSEKSSIWGVVFKVFECLLFAVAIWLSSSYLLSYIFNLIFGEDRGCSISMISGAVIAIIASIWILIDKLS